MLSSKIFTIFAGVNGAGKSTLFHMVENEDLGIRLNSDEIVKENKGNWNNTDDQIKAGKQLLIMQEDCFSKGLSCNRETTLAGSNIIKSIEMAKNLGYKINLRYVSVSTVEIAKKRIKKRISLGGHGVSDEVIDRRFRESLDNFIKIFNLCDSIFIYDNSGKKMVLVAYLKDKKLKRTNIVCEWCDSLLRKINEIK